VDIRLHLFAFSIVGILLPSCSPLSVKPISKDEQSSFDGIPVYLPKQEFVVTKLGRTTDGQPAPQAQYRVDLVTSRDETRGFIVQNEPSALASTDFGIIRAADGTLLSVDAKAEDKTLQTVKEVAKLVVAVAAAGVAGDPLEDERKAQEAALRTADTQSLADAAAEGDVERIASIQEAIDTTSVRLAALEQALRQKQVALLGTEPSGTLTPEIHIPSDADFVRVRDCLAASAAVGEIASEDERGNPIICDDLAPSTSTVDPAFHIVLEPST
jgi:hypothetical protein